MKVDLWPIDRVKPYEKNPRINDGAVDAVAASLREYGWRQPIVVDPDGVIIVGHTRWKAALHRRQPEGHDRRTGFRPTALACLDGVGPKRARGAG